MPNSSHGGGISRKISSAADRKRLKSIIAELNLPKTMGCIVRTAGLARTKTEIKRDFDYLARLWDELRETTLKSSAPALIHSDSDLIKRAIRDIYNRDIEEVIVEGEDGYRAAKDFMKLLMPSHARRVKPYADAVPLFQRYGAEDQLSAMYDPVVQLKSGGYIVINPTEALVSIDINSGRSTKEYGIEATALNTNLEAAREVARQLRLRDMAGLVVIDFIDMEYGSNVRKVEKAMKDALKNDRARIQVGRISSFGLMEMSRQRLRTGVLEATTRECPHCDGTGLVRTASSAGLSALRLIEDEAAKGKGTTVSLFASTEAAVYLLNAKRADLADIEARYGVTVEVIPEGENEGAKMRVLSSGPRPTSMPVFEPIVDDQEEEEDYLPDDEADDESDADFEGDGASRRKRRRRRGGKGRRGEREQAGDEAQDAEADAESEAETSDGAEEEDGDAPRKRRRRGGRRRRGRGRGADGEDLGESQAEGLSDEEPQTDAVEEVEAPVEKTETEAVLEVEAVAEEAPAKPRRTRRKKADPSEAEATEAAPAEQGEAAIEPVAEEAGAEAVAEEAPAKPKRTRRKKAEPSEAEATEAPVVEEAPAKPKRTRRKKPVASEVEGTEGVVAEEVSPAETAPAEVVAADEPVASMNDAESAENTEPSAPSTANEPPRRGWWQRTFGD